MKENIKFFTIFTLCCIVLWYVCNILVWIEIQMKPYTPTGKMFMSWTQHIIFLTIVPFWATVFILSAISDKKKRG
jgi:hypothetical protein